MKRGQAIALVGGAVAAGVVVSWLLYPTPLRRHEAAVPALRGLPFEVAVQQLEAVGLRGRDNGRANDPEVPSGSVAWQVPAPGTVLPESALVQLTTSAGPPAVLVPELARLDLGTALEVLAAAGLRVGGIDSQRAREPDGIVIESRPAAGRAVRAGGEVRIIVSGQRGRDNR